MSTSWKSGFEDLLRQSVCEQDLESLSTLYSTIFTDSYRESSSVEQAVNDCMKVELLANDHSSLSFLFDIHKKDLLSNSINIRLYQLNKTIPLSDIIPVLENFGLRANHDETHRIKRSEGKVISIIDFTVSLYKEPDYTLDEFKENFIHAITDVTKGSGENDGFNKLIILGNFDLRTINIFRSYSKYLRQVKYRYSQEHIENTLINQIDIAKKLVSLFNLYHHPENNNSEEANQVENDIIAALLSVNDIVEDNIIRRLMLLVKSTLRTNYFQLNEDNAHKDYITLKINPTLLPDMPQPVPLVDTFVYSSEFEGIHLRSHKVSRGGIRWSDRHDDYRTEVLGLMKAQKVKNSVIIPSGAKGGFVLKGKNIEDYNERKKNVIACYQKFISGMLDITDNIVGDAIVKPSSVVCHDDDDPYFVVAADKGTADLSDHANAVSRQHSFWLDDAFASGGSNGYDHKKLGITARGAWESLKRNLQELDRHDSDITMVGVGDMSGDVFGNGLLCSDRIKLIAAFDHRHIFIDPNPATSQSFTERSRLFQLPQSTWEDYNKDLISSGGGVFKRTDKSIPLSNEIKLALDITESVMTPDQLICAILKAPVDVLYNGGIGTYVKASRETSENIGDKINEFCRINGNQLRCKIACEGGNLGFTQLGRVEFSLNGGLINTDFIDNSAGVDCSDHEVNIKILLNKAKEANKITADEYGTILSSMGDDICKLVLQDNYSQALVMSYTAVNSNKYFDLYHEQLQSLESMTGLNRSIEYLPTDEELVNRKSSNKSLTKPELAILLAYTKIHVKDEIIKSDLPDQAFFKNILLSAFPVSLSERFHEEINAHYLRREIIASKISNDMINTMGISFVFRLQNETGASISEIATAFILSATIFKSEEMLKEIQSLDNKVNVSLQYELMHHVRVLLNMSSRWFLRSRRLKNDLSEIVNSYKTSVEKVSAIMPSLIRGSTKDYMASIVDKFSEYAIDNNITRRIAMSRVLYTSLNISEVASIHHFDIEHTAELYFHVGGAFNLVWFRDYLANDNKPGKQSNMARLTLREDLDALQRRLTIVIMQSDPSEKDVKQLTANWRRDNENMVNRWNNLMEETIEGQSNTYTRFFISFRELSTMLDGAANIEKMTLLAYHDALTKLPNRHAIMHRLDQLEMRAKSNNELFAIHFIDINKFKYINDTFGHDIGDKVLLEVTKRLDSAIRSSDFAARQSGDEFIVIQTGVKAKADVLTFANILLKVINKPLPHDDHEIAITASIGSAIYPSHGKTSLEIISNADKAMYKCKAKGLNRAVIFDDLETSTL